MDKQTLAGSGRADAVTSHLLDRLNYLAENGNGHGR